MIRRVAAQYRRAFSGLPAQVWYLAFVVLVNRAGSMVLPFLSLYVVEGLGMDDYYAGWMLFVYGIGSCSGSFVGGLVSDKLGPFRVQIFSLLLSGLGYCLMSTATSFWMLASIVIATSFFADAFRPANGASITLLVKPELHKRAFSLNRLAVNLGYTVGPTVGGLLASRSFELLFWIDGLTCWAAAVTFIMFLGFRAPKTSDRSDAAARPSEGNSDSMAVWRNYRFISFLLLTFLTFCVFFQLISTFPLFLKAEYALTKFQIGTLFGFNTICVVAFEMVLIQSLDHARLMRLIAWGSMLMCLGYGLLPFGQGYLYAMFTVSFWTLGEMLAMPQMLAYVAQSSNDRNRSIYMGYYTTCVALAMMIGPLIGTQLYQRDHYDCWHWATIVGVFVFAGFMWLDRTLKVQEATTQKTLPSEPL